MSEKKSTIPKGILERSEARLAAVKAIYATDINSHSEEKTDPWAITLDIVSSYSDNNSGHFAKKLDQKYLSKIISGVFTNIEEIDKIIEQNLSDTWSKERIGHVMLALLRAAVLELTSFQKIPFKVIINEYINIARVFFAEKEVSFVNGILDKIARTVRE